MKQRKQNTVAFLTLGCKVNSYETAAMEKLFLDAGWERKEFKEDADVYIVNTCTVTNIADKKSRQMLHRAKKKNPDSVIVAAGCYAQASQQELAADPLVDVIIGNEEKGTIVSIIEEYKRTHKKKEDVKELTGHAEYEGLFIDSIPDKTRAYIKIQDGCNQFCSYCIIPYVRGRIRSRAKEEIWKEVNGLAEKGYQEIVLTGIHLSSYGLDKDGKSHLLDVIKELNRIDGIKRIRLGSLEPRIVIGEFAGALAECEKVCPHFHLSLQSGCNSVLERMNRHYTTKDYLKACDSLRRVFEYPAITTDIIVGFPGETEEEFEETKKFVQQIGFAKMHIFPYSRRKGTVAEQRKDQVEEEIKHLRSRELLQLEEKLRLCYEKKLIGTKQEVLFEEPIAVKGQIYQVGHTTRYQRIAVPEEKEWSNRLIMVEITDQTEKNCRIGKQVVSLEEVPFSCR